MISAMGDSYLLCRIAPVEGQFERALKHAGEATKQMRLELATAVVKLFDGCALLLARIREPLAPTSGTGSAGSSSW